MRILTVMNCPRGSASGMPRGNASLSRELRDQGAEVDHVYLEDYPRAVRADPVNYPALGLFTPRLVRRMERARGPYDVVQLSGGEAWIAPRLRHDVSGRRRLVVARSHGLEQAYWRAFMAEVRAGHTHANRRHRLYFGGLRLRQVAAASRLADLDSMHTLSDANEVVRRHWKDSSAVTVIPSGVESAWLSEPLGPRSSRGRLLFSGSWTWMKGPWVLAAAFGELSRRRPGLRLRVIGTGVLATEVLAAFPAEVRSAVDVAPPLAHDDVRAEMRIADVLLGTSMYEGFGTVVLEAMAAGLPVVASAVGAAPDFVNAATGELVAAGDVPGLVAAVERTLDRNPDADMRVRTAARAAVGVLEWGRIASRTLEVYGAALASVRG